MQIKWYNGTTVQWYKTIYEERQRRDAMPVDKQVLLRYQVLNKCFRNRWQADCHKPVFKADGMQIYKKIPILS